MPRNHIDFESIKKQIGTLSGSKRRKREPDKRFFTLNMTDTDKAAAIIRFLPPPVGEPNCIVSVSNHYFPYVTPDGNKFFYEECPKTIGKECPICEYYFTHKEDNRKKRTTAFITNILVIKDPSNPENEGKVFLFKFRNDVMKKIDDATDPKDGISQPMNIFDLDNAPNFKYVCTNQNGPDGKKMPRYQDSSWTAAGPIVIKGQQMSDEFLDSLSEKVYSLKEFTDPAKFKSYDEIKGKFDLAVNNLTDAAVDEKMSSESAPVSNPGRTEADNMVNAADSVSDDYFDTL